MRKENGQDTDAALIAWQMFEKTGNVSYYMLYHELNRKDEKN